MKLGLLKVQQMTINLTGIYRAPDIKKERILFYPNFDSYKEHARVLPIYIKSPLFPRYHLESCGLYCHKLAEA